MQQTETQISGAEVWGVTVLMIGSMRLVHPLMSLFNRRTIKASSNTLAIVFAVVLILVVIGTQVTTFVSVNHISEQHREHIISCALRVTFFELVIWDFLLQPLLLAAISKISKKAGRLFPALY